MLSKLSKHQSLLESAECLCIELANSLRKPEEWMNSLDLEDGAQFAYKKQRKLSRHKFEKKIHIKNIKLSQRVANVKITILL